MDCIKEEPKDICINLTYGSASSGVPIDLDSDVRITFKVTLSTHWKYIKEVRPWEKEVTLDEFLKIIETRNTNGTT